MNKFEKDKDLNITEDGRAQDRIPGDLSLEALQQGTVINATMVNSWVFEIVNAIKKLGATPDRNKENQLIEALNQKTIYDQVGQVNSWLCSSSYIPRTEAVLDGSMLYASNYEDGLAMLKKRCPSWRSGDNIKLPDYRERFQRIDPNRLGYTEEDLMQKVSISVTSSAKAPAVSDITLPGRYIEYVRKDGTDKGLPARVHPGKNALGGLTTENNPIYFTNTKSTFAQSGGCLHLWLYEDRNDRKTISLGDVTFSVTKKELLQDGASGKEFRPKNFAVIMTVVAGIPK